LTQTLNEQRFIDHDPLVIAASHFNIKDEEIKSLQKRISLEIKLVEKEALAKMVPKP
jgi:hypothetical protein